MISLSAAVSVVLYLVIGAVIFGLLFFLLNYIGGLFGEGATPFVKVGKIILVVLAVLVCIGVLLSLVGGQPLFRP